MRKDQTPPSLSKAATDAAVRAYGLRLKEIKVMASSLKLLDAYMPALVAKDVAPPPSGLTWAYFERSICIAQCHFSDRSTRLHAALLELGFVQFARYDYATFSTVGMKKGRLKLRLHLAPLAKGTV